MLYPVSDSATNLSQPAGNASLIVNQGSEPVYLDKGSTVSPNSYSILLAPNQSFNWSGGELWGVCATGAASTVSLMAGANTSVSPITNATLTGPVTVDTIIGNVNVDGSTVDIGNNVRLWGGGDYLGTKTIVLPSAGSYQDTIGATFPNSLLQRYSSIAIMVQMVTLSATFSIDVSVSAFGSGYIQYVSQMLMHTPSSQAFTYDANNCFIQFPILQDLNVAALTIDNTRAVACTVRVDAYGSYSTIAEPIYFENVFARLLNTQVWSPGVITSNIDFYFRPRQTERVVYLKPVSGAVVSAVYHTMITPDTGGYGINQLDLIQTGITAGATLKYVLPASRNVQGIRIVAGANTAPSYGIYTT